MNWRRSLLLCFAVFCLAVRPAISSDVASLTCTEDPACKGKADQCEERQIQLSCPVTCKACDLKLNCRDELSSDKCNAFFEAGLCHTQPREMAAKCQKTCLFCQAATSCPKGWMMKDSYCFLASKTARTFDAANAKCKQQIGGSLVSITSAADATQVAEIAKAYGLKESWIGLFVNNDGLLQFADNSQFNLKASFTQFPGGKVALQSGFGVVSSFASKSWQLRKLTEKRPYICSRLPTGFCRNKCGKNAFCKWGVEGGKHGYKCHCLPGTYGDPLKACERPCECRAFGDPHYSTYDNALLHFMGRCTYHLTRTIKSLLRTGCEFDVHVRNEDRRPKSIQFHSRDLSWTKFVEIHFKGARYRFLKGNKLMVNGVLVKTAKHVQVIEEKLTFTAPAECGHVVVSFDGEENALVSIDRTIYGEKVEGLCADCNTVETDDYVTRTRVDLRNDKERDAKIGNSWRVQNLSPEEKEERKCDAEINVWPVCSFFDEIRVKQFCGQFTDKSHALWGKCYHLLYAIADGCFWDYCANSTLFLSRQCSYFEVAARACRVNNVRMEKWREAKKCPMKCPENSKYTYEAPRSQQLCPQAASKQLTTEEKHGREGCVCNDGFKRLGTRCVRNCGCTAEDGSLKEVGDEWISEDCSKKFKCVAWKKTTIVQQRCGRNAECSVRGGVRDCHCKLGFQGNPFRICRDINECTEKKKNGSPCGRNSVCANSVGSFKCTCEKGYRPHEGENGFTCINTNECELKLCPGNATCTDTIGSFTCACQSGFKMSADKKSCHYLESCTTKKCSAPHSYCKNLPGDYQCVCDVGFKDANNGRDRHNPNCIDIDECQSRRCRRMEKCINTPGSFRCDCRRGKRVRGRCLPVICEDLSSKDSCGNNGNCMMTTSGDVSCKCKPGFFPGPGGKKIQLKCTDDNECAKKPCAKNALCTNTDGGYRCDCKTGFHGNGNVKCGPDNPCTLNPDVCGDNAICLFAGIPATHVCKCQAGFRANEKGLCENINECRLKIDDCDRALSVCKDLVPAGEKQPRFFCECKDGARMNPVTKRCEDINECNDHECRDPCGANQLCQNLSPGYRCKCKPGFVRIKEQCENVNECTAKNPCPTSMQCIDTPGSYACRCKPGFKMGADGSSCEDINECLVKNKCSKHATCTNVPGHYTCACKAGFTGDGFVCHKENVKCESGKKCECADGYRREKGECVNINECTDAAVKHKCHANATCEDTGGSYVCHCKGGFCGTGYECDDDDECSGNKHNCHVKATCFNVPGSFACTCQAGFYGDGVHCEDIDECVSKVDGCINSLCVNSYGGYACQCLPGFKVSAKSTKECENIDECEETPNICGPNARCEDRPGSFRCVCNAGFTMQNKRCVDENECESNPCGKYMTCTNTVGSYKCDCLPGFRKEGKSCMNIDECKEKSPCDENAICTDNKGSYSCACKSGFSGNGRSCEDVDECLFRGAKAVCDKNAVCVNKIGGYECRCKGPHWIGSGELPQRCQHNKIDECKTQEKVCLENQNCVDLAFGFKCVCKAGYVVSPSDKRLCEDRNECEDKSAKCPANAKCGNTVGSYKCTCKDGFLKTKDGKCLDIDECKSGAHRCIEETSRCANTEGGYRCACREGYERGGSMYECEDKNECEQRPCKGAHAKCTNTPGAFFCGCAMGYRPSRAGCVKLTFVVPSRTQPPRKAHVTYSPFG